MSSEPSELTVVIPTWNRCAFLEKAIASVRAQSYQHWQLIVVDDGSTDDTIRMVRSLADERIRLLSLPHAGNIASLRNAGAALGQGGWIAFLDSDDLWLPDKLAIQMEGLVRSKKRWAYGGFEMVDENGSTIPNKTGSYHPYSGWIAKEIITAKAAVAIGSLVVERSLFESLGGFNTSPALLYREDYELAFRLALVEEGLALPGLMVRITEHERRSTRLCGQGHRRSAAVYEHFVALKPGAALERIARSRQAHYLAEAGLAELNRKNYGPALQLIWKAGARGDRIRHLLSVLKRGFIAPPHSKETFLSTQTSAHVADV
jgi:glycosyltransferase involved in cell wall biosynthesis